MQDRWLCEGGSGRGLGLGLQEFRFQGCWFSGFGVQSFTTLIQEFSVGFDGF